ncbi:MAG: thiol oxidoreductase [Proteobacteria bacterium]|nr:thiol oxidoreductase [Pseudomonadota bacterium]
MSGSSLRRGLLACALLARSALCSQDPGLRLGPADGGQPLPGLTAVETAIFSEAFQRMVQLEAVCDTCADLTLGAHTDPAQANLVTQTNSAGLGIRFNGDQCSVCHNQPAVGGSGGFMVPNPGAAPAQQRRPENPMFDLIAHRKGAINTVPSFITRYGPIREVRFVRRPDGSADGGVHQLFTVVGRSDVFPPGQADTCNSEVMAQPDFEQELQRNNLRFRIPLQLFGLGIIDGIQDREILARHAASAAMRARLGIVGVANRSGNDGTITRFGWKAQNKSLAVFSGEAYNVEMGVTNDVFPQATDETPQCLANKSEPNDILRTDADDSRNQSYYDAHHQASDWLMFSMFMRLLDAPRPAPLSASAQRGKLLFGEGPQLPGIGCVGCHTAAMVTPAQSETPALQNVTARLYSDLLIHHMGRNLADDITQGKASGDMFRTTPLWGVGQRRFFLHDGRTDDLLKAIHVHYSPPADCDRERGRAESRDGGEQNCYGPSEANTVVLAFRALSDADQQAILDFLRAL